MESSPETFLQYPLRPIHSVAYDNIKEAPHHQTLMLIAGKEY